MWVGREANVGMWVGRGLMWVVGGKEANAGKWCGYLGVVPRGLWVCGCGTKGRGSKVGM